MFTKWLQDIFDVELWFQFPDEEKFLFKKKLSYQDVQKALEENMLDVIAVGFNNKKTKFLIDTRHANLMFKEAIKVSKHITLSTAKGIFGFTNDTNIGAIFYTSMQAVPAFLPSILENKNIPCLIPYAIDQDPHFRASRDVIPKLGYYKPASIEGIFLPGLKGMESDGKMSSSDLDNSTIYVSDDPETVKRKINKYAYSGGQPTIEEHRRLGGNPDIDVSYQWLRFFEEDDEKLKEIYNDYKKGKLLSGEIKKLAIESINTYLKELQKRREDSSKLLPKFLEWYEAYR
jgi:tryptophanyl-tRNA synthetase